MGHDGALATDNALLHHLARLVDNQLAPGGHDIAAGVDLDHLASRLARVDQHLLALSIDHHLLDAALDYLTACEYLLTLGVHDDLLALVGGHDPLLTALGLHHLLHHALLRLD